MPRATRFHDIARPIVIALLLGSVPVSTLASGLYLGAGGVYTDFDDADEDSHLGYRAYGGYDFFRVPLSFSLGIEGGYTRTGRVDTNDGSTRLENGDVGLQLTITTLPLLDFHGRAGYEWGDTEGGMYALGASVSVLPLTRIRAEYQNRNDFDAGMLSLEIRLP